MNERIRKLYDQAIIIEDGGDYVCGELDPEKFAELIIRECAQAMMDYGKTYAHPSAGEYQSNEFSKVIKQHFGVEEC